MPIRRGMRRELQSCHNVIQRTQVPMRRHPAWGKARRGRPL